MSEDAVEQDGDLPAGHCPGCGQVTFGGKHPELRVEYGGEERSTRICEECVGSALDVISAVKNGGSPADEGVR